MGLPLSRRDFHDTCPGGIQLQTPLQSLLRRTIPGPSAEELSLRWESFRSNGLSDPLAGGGSRTCPRHRSRVGAPWTPGHLVTRGSGAWTHQRSIPAWRPRVCRLLVSPLHPQGDTSGPARLELRWAPGLGNGMWVTPRSLPTCYAGELTAVARACLSDPGSEGRLAVRRCHQPGPCLAVGGVEVWFGFQKC